MAELSWDGGGGVWGSWRGGEVVGRVGRAWRPVPHRDLFHLLSEMVFARGQCLPVTDEMDPWRGLTLKSTCGYPDR